MINIDLVKTLDGIKKIAVAYDDLKNKIVEISAELKKLKDAGISVSKITDGLAEIGRILEQTVGDKPNKP